MGFEKALLMQTSANMAVSEMSIKWVSSGDSIALGRRAVQDRAASFYADPSGSFFDVRRGLLEQLVCRLNLPAQQEQISSTAYPAFDKDFR